MMQTLESNNAKCQIGLTLFELLIALVLISFMTVIASANFGNASQNRILAVAAQQMRADFIRARTKAYATNSTVSIYLSEGGYSIPGLELEREFSKKVTVTPGKNGIIMLGQGSWLRAHTIRLSSGNISTAISISPLTRKVEIQNAQ